ncbi:MAG: DUF2809 domain-containing protein [bacterium]
MAKPITRDALTIVDTPTYRMPPSVRARATYLALTLGTIALGLAVHTSGAVLGAATRDVLGDALWAVMITWALGTLVPDARLPARGAVALAICYGVEVSQLVHSPVLDAMRATNAGRLMLGSGFDPRDLVAYSAGVLAAILAERLVRSRRTVPATAPPAR